MSSPSAAPGGKHRSVTLAGALYGELAGEEQDYGIKIEHRDIGKDAVTKGNLAAENAEKRSRG